MKNRCFWSGRLWSYALTFVILTGHMAVQRGFAAEVKRERKSSILPVPALFYTPETGTGGGVGLVYTYQVGEDPEDSKPAMIIPALIYTEKKQTIGRLFSQHYLVKRRYFVDTGFYYTNYPDRFYGTGRTAPLEGEESFTERYVAVNLDFYMRLMDDVYLGPSYRFDTAKLVDLEESGRLASGDIDGATPTTVRGLGVGFINNTRDNEFTPRQGRYLELRRIFFDRRFASERTFQQDVARLRYYHPWTMDLTSALELVYEGNGGEVPFRKLALLGGQYRLRGHFLGRFRDRHLAFAQTDLRYTFTDRFGALVFVGSGRIAKARSELAAAKPISTYGMGLRYLVLREERVGFRLDLAFGDDESAVYFGVGEAF